MRITVIRYASAPESTLGLLFINGQFECYTLEDEYRTEKKYAETRIPAGLYHIKLRKVGGFHARYKRKFPKFHVGMLEIMDVPGFKYVLIHIGNKDDDTAGCLLVGDSTNNNQIADGFIGSSRQAYKRFYQKVLLFMGAEQNNWINIIDNINV